MNGILNKKRNLYLFMFFVITLFLFIVWTLLQTALKPPSETSNAKPVPEGIPVPIIMYHGLIKDPKLQTNYFIHPQTFKKDLDYLKKEGYTTILMKDLIDYVQNKGDLPEKPIVLTFDDGYYNNYEYAYPLLKERNMKAIISIIGSMTDKFSLVDENNPAYAHVTWEQINEMIGSGLIEVQNHTYNMHTSDKGRKGASQKPGESLEAYKKVLADDVGGLQERIWQKTGTWPTTFTFPFGFLSKNTEEAIEELGFSATLGCEKGINYVVRDPKSLFKMKRILRPLHMSSEEFFQKIKP